VFKKLWGRSETFYGNNNNNSSRVCHVSDQSTQTQVCASDLIKKSAYHPLFKESEGDHRSFLSVGILGLECNAMADTGAAVSIINQSAYLLLQREGLCFPLQTCAKDLAV
jgi:hypothetical protein